MIRDSEILNKTLYTFSIGRLALTTTVLITYMYPTNQTNLN